MVNNSLTTKRAPGERRLQRKRTIGPTCGPLGPGETPSFAPTVSERRPLPDANRVIWLDNFGRLLGGNNGRATDRLDRSHHHWRNRRLARRAVHEEPNGACDEHCAGHHRSLSLVGYSASSVSRLVVG